MLSRGATALGLAEPLQRYRGLGFKVFRDLGFGVEGFGFRVWG